MISSLLVEERYNYLQEFEVNKAHFLVHLEKKSLFACLKKYFTFYVIL